MGLSVLVGCVEVMVDGVAVVWAVAVVCCAVAVVVVVVLWKPAISLMM